jgi:hypothetical protein
MMGLWDIPDLLSYSIFLSTQVRIPRSPTTKVTEKE